jgi:hypothetical protein
MMEVEQQQSLNPSKLLQNQLIVLQNQLFG